MPLSDHLAKRLYACFVSGPEQPPDKQFGSRMEGAGSALAAAGDGGKDCVLDQGKESR